MKNASFRVRRNTEQQGMRTLRALSLAALVTIGISANAAPAQNVDKINNWFKNVDKMYPNLNKDRPVGNIQPAGNIQKAGEIQTVRGIQAIHSTKAPCAEKFVVGADALFEFDKSTLTPRAEETLSVLAPMIQKLGTHPISVEGHTDSIGGDTYNQSLSERRAERVRNWLLENHLAQPNAATIIGYGKKRPVAPNTKRDGSDNPPGRALNRRVEISVDTCHDANTQPTATTPAPVEVPANPGQEAGATPIATPPSDQPSPGQ